MKACVLKSVGNLVYQDVPVPQIKNDEVLLQIKACGICSSDIPRIFQTGTYHFPTIPGHEFSGEVVEVGKNVSSKVIGKRAAVFPLLPCGKCSSCQTGEYARCDSYSYFGSRCDGAFAEYLAVPFWNLAFFDPQLPFTTAALCEPAAVAKHCVDSGHIELGENVVVVGTGTIGLMAALWSQLSGANKVIVIGRSRAKLEFAKSLGIEYTLNSTKENVVETVRELTENHGADVTLECVGNSAAITTAITTAKKGGRVVLTGNPNADIILEKSVYWEILRNELVLSGTWNSHFSCNKNDWKTTLDFMTEKKLPFEKLVTHTFPLKEYQKAMDTVRSKEEVSIKVMFEM